MRNLLCLSLIRRLYQFIKLYLFNSSSGLYSCPLAMTDGCAFLIREIQAKNPSYVSQNMKYAYERLTTTNPNHFWTSGQWVKKRVLYFVDD